MTTPSEHDDSPLTTRRPRPAELLFAIALVTISVVLLALSPWQLKFFDNLRLFAQPATLPLLSLAGIAVFALIYSISLYRQRDAVKHEHVSQELWLWARAIEYPLWFLAYVYVVPYTGYLPATLLFCPLLTFRLGYRTARPLIWSVVAGLAVVLVFKAFLQVKIPGGALYELLPPAIRNFLIIYG